VILLLKKNIIVLIITDLCYVSQKQQKEY